MVRFHIGALADTDCRNNSEKKGDAVLAFVMLWLLSQLKLAKDGRFYVVHGGKTKYLPKGTVINLCPCCGYEDDNNQVYCACDCYICESLTGKTCLKKGETVKKFTIVGTGSRELVQDQGKFAQVLAYLTDLLAKAKAKHGENLLVISGMAEGFDEALARAAIANNISLLAAIPNRGYSKYYWRDHSLTDLNRLAEFQELANYANSTGGVVYTCGCVKNQPAKCGHWDGRVYNFQRNNWMVDQADIVWVYNPTTRGTAQAYKYARDKGVRTFIVPVVS